MEGRPEEARHPAAQWYVARDTQLRSALARARAQRAGVDPQRHQRSFSGYDAQIDEVVGQAMNSGPLERTLMLDRLRWLLLDQLVGPDTFAAAAVFAYAFKLLLVERWQSLSEAEGLRVAGAIVEQNATGLQV